MNPLDLFWPPSSILQFVCSAQVRALFTTRARALAFNQLVGQGGGKGANRVIVMVCSHLKMHHHKEKHLLYEPEQNPLTLSGTKDNSLVFCYSPRKVDVDT